MGQDKREGGTILGVDILPLDVEKFASVPSSPTHVTVKGCIGHVTSLQFQ